jgi:5-(carboxyamino)imidazole ribonucleotide synthase
VLEPAGDCPAGQVAERLVEAGYEDAAGLDALAAQCAAVTTEFENVPAASLSRLAQRVFVAPNAHGVSVAQDRIAEKSFFVACAPKSGVMPAPHKVIASERRHRCHSRGSAARHPEDRAHGLRRQGPGARAFARGRARRLRFDGPGDLPAGEDAAAGLRGLGADRARRMTANRSCIRSPRTCTATASCSPPPCRARTCPHECATKAQDAARAIVAELGYVGVLCIEFFVLADGSLVVNEMAPRPHNSGHYTIDACVTSQFAQQVRAMARLPLGDVRQHSPAVMLNILGDVWFEGDGTNVREPAWDQVLALPGANLHLYGKDDPRRGRKMGHVTFVAPTLARRSASFEAACAILGIEV